MDNPFRIFDEIREAYLRYLRSPFRLRYDALLSERDDLLDRDRQLYREPLFEPLAPHESSQLTAVQACARLGVAQDAAAFITSGGDRGLFPAARTLHRHQFEAWQELRNGKAVVVTSGTGSGKTECYLLPIFAYLVEESARGWGRPGPKAPGRFWWRARRQPRVLQRSHDPPERAAAVRALLLYPLNALIEDQLGRIREACDGQRARQWLDSNRMGHRFWFGRYTGITPVSGPQASNSKRNELRRRLHDMDLEWNRARASAAARSDPRILYYFQDPDGSEMWSRWDMQDTPPDILITNYSMLNIMLMRSVEDGVFDATRRWLASDERNLFHLVVDELHSYRGTPGTEVGYLLRALLHRIGLTPDSPQLRIIATSASIEKNDPGSLDYLEQFFGRDRSSFAIVPGYPLAFASPAGGLSAHAAAVAALDPDIDLDEANAARNFEAAVGLPASADPADLTLSRCLEHIQAFEPVRQAAHAGPFTVDALAASVFPAAGALAPAAARGMIRALVLARTTAGTAPLPVRAHYFFHNAGRIWACVNPACPGRTGVTPPGAQPPPVGVLFSEPGPRCPSCNSRILELLYCQPCGEVFLGGYKKADPQSPDPQSPTAWYLSPDYPNLEGVPDKSASLRRSSGEYLVFWPADSRALVKRTHAGPKWQWQQEGVPGFAWAPAVLDHTSGRLTLPRRTGPLRGGCTSGYVFRSPIDTANAFASKCPHCGADWAKRRIGSPIRDLGSGFQRIVQLLCDALMREMPPGAGRKLVLFSDSRQDAAKLSTGIKLSHYLDSVRQIAYAELRNQAVGAAAARSRALSVTQSAQELLALEEKRDQGGLDQTERERRQSLLSSLSPEVAGEVARFAAVGGTPPSVLRAPPALGPFISVSFNSLLDTVPVGVCRLCQALVETPSANGGCPYCSAARGDGGYRAPVDLTEPPGFNTWWSIKAEFSGGFEFTPRALRARLGAMLHNPTLQRNFVVDAGPARVYRINDRDGEDFLFRKVDGHHIWISEDAFDQALQDLPQSERAAVRPPQYDLTVQPLTRALAAIASTDVLTAGIDTAPVGLCLNPVVPEARAAWCSFGFLLRRAAAVRLDVAEAELDLGIQPVIDFSSPFAPPSARIFISDSLENGAGYSTHLGEPGRFEELLLFMVGQFGPRSRDFYDPFVLPSHEQECASSCHRCLREYGNMAYHPLLDWRSALDMAWLALDASRPIDLTAPWWQPLVARVAVPYFQGLNLTPTTLGGLPAGTTAVTNEAIILTHPLWDRDRANFRPDVAAAVAEAERRGLRWELKSIFRAVRFPYE